MKVAIPVENGIVAEHFGHAPQFIIYDVSEGEIQKEVLTPPPHQPGVIPQWLHSLGVTHVLCGHMGMRALAFFEDFGIEVITGVPPLPADEVLKMFLQNSLQVEPKICRGGHGIGCGRQGAGYGRY